MRCGWILVALAGCGGGEFQGQRVAGADGSTSNSVCANNDTRECACPGAAKGAQTCDVDGAWGRCACVSAVNDDAQPDGAPLGAQPDGSRIVQTDAGAMAERTSAADSQVGRVTDAGIGRDTSALDAAPPTPTPCTDPARFVVSADGQEVFDTLRQLRWWRAPGMGINNIQTTPPAGYCYLLPGPATWQIPTAAVLADLGIGFADTCIPRVDVVAFPEFDSVTQFVVQSTAGTRECIRFRGSLAVELCDGQQPYNVTCVTNQL